MHRYVIERELPGLGKFTAEQLREAARASCAALQALGPDIQWEHSYVTGDRMYCIYLAKNEELVREHAKRGGFPANKVVEVVRVIDRLTANK
jgi:nucleotidyltransferase/DNA polymerase involved in DNA repair